MSTAEEFKAKGNAALQAGNTSEAVEFYTKAINLDGANHLYYSNRSAAYLKKGDANNALEDANACIGLKPDFPKGYSRKGAALHALKRYNDSIAAYEQGLNKFPDDAGLKKGLEDVRREKENPLGSSSTAAGAGAGGLFSPQMVAQMALDPRLRPFLDDPDVMKKIQLIQTNPNMLTTMLQDEKLQKVFAIMAGIDTPSSSTTETRAASQPKSTPKQAEPMEVDPPKQQPGEKGTSSEPAKQQEKEQEPEEDLSHLSDAEREIKEKQKAAVKKKEEGNALYKEKKFTEALAAYDEAIALDPKNMTFWSNKAAVYLTDKKYDECIEACLKAVEVGKENRAPYEERAKALTRAAKACQKKGDLAKAIDMCNESLLENYDSATQRLLKTLELEKKKADALAYQSDEKAEEAKQRGNELFREQKWGEAVKEYEEAVKRAPKNATIRNNLAAALCKIMDFSGAQRQIEEALVLDPKYVKAWARKGDIEMYMKEYHKALESFKKGLEIDPENTACKEGLQKCTMQINYGRQKMTDAEKKEQAAHAMADPEIQAILQDPVMQQVLRDLQENPAAGQQAISNPAVRSKIEKLIAAGIIETG